MQLLSLCICICVVCIEKCGRVSRGSSTTYQANTYMAYFTPTNSQHQVPPLRVLSTMVSVGRLLGLIALLMLVATLVCTGVRSEKSTAEEIKDTISEWRDMIVSSVSNKLDEITDFDTISRIIDATLEEDCELEPCKPGKKVLILFF